MAASPDGPCSAYNWAPVEASFCLNSPVDYARYLERTRQALYVRLRGAPAGDLVSRYFERGKMLRAFLVFAACAAVGGDPDDALMAAEAIELLHGASLFHDDIMDHAAERRGLVALHQQLGVAQALVIGDDLLLRAFTALADAHTRHPAETVLHAMEALNQLARKCCRGQFEELRASRWISEEQYFAIIEGKTASPFIAASVLGVLLGGGTQWQLAQVRVYAREVGIAFQIHDDLLDLVGEPGSMGKPVGNSLMQGRPMLPLIYLWEEASEAVRSKLCQLGNNECGRDELIALLQQHGILERILQVRTRHLDAAVAALKDFDNSTGMQGLCALACRPNQQ
jgi:geranylgeranyl diphosphate synthase, type I